MKRGFGERQSKSSACCYFKGQHVFKGCKNGQGIVTYLPKKAKEILFVMWHESSRNTSGFQHTHNEKAWGPLFLYLISNLIQCHTLFGGPVGLGVMEIAKKYRAQEICQLEVTSKKKKQCYYYIQLTPDRSESSSGTQVYPEELKLVSISHLVTYRGICWFLSDLTKVSFTHFQC